MKGPNMRSIKEKEYARRLKVMQKLPNDTRFYWQSYGYVGNALNLWASGSCGYTTNIAAAQTYSKEETIQQLKCMRDQDTFWTYQQLQDAVVMMVDSQNIKGGPY